MPDFALLGGTVRSSYGDPPQLPLVNMFAEKAITEPRQFKLRSRERLYTFGSVISAGAVTRALHRWDRTPAADSIAVYNTSVYVDNVSQGTLAVSGYVSIASNSVGAVMTAGEDAKFWDGTTFRSVTFPSSLTVLKIIEQGGRFIAIPDGSISYFWTEPYDAMIDGSGDILFDVLDFASAEAESDSLVDGLAYRDAIILGGERTIEVHYPTGVDTAPWAPTIGSQIDSGVIQTGCMTTWNDGFAWVTPDWTIEYSTGIGHERISNSGIEEVLPTMEQVILDSFEYAGQEFLRVRPVDYDNVPSLPHLLLSAQTGEWCEWSSEGGEFLGGCVEGGSSLGLIFGSLENGQSLHLSTTGTTAEDIPDKSFCFGLPIDGGEISIDNVLLRCQTDLASATITLTTSNDKGRTFTSRGSRTLDGTRNRVSWRALGKFDQAGFLGKCTVANAAEFAVSGALYNEPGGGRSR